MRVIINLTTRPIILYEIDDSAIIMNQGNIRNRKEVSNFLEDSEYLGVFLDDTLCVFGEKRIMHYSTLKTDGDWIWSSDIIHYTKEHNFILPKAFLEHIEKSKYKPKKFDSDPLKIYSLINDSKNLLNTKIMEVIKL